ncbi:hypothetical protein QBC38DRAFT_499386 [Podospora fimiseda]|uniref:Uncharacterized protein n=1 Tax=Podospora fimiseda TaxID=252190 RepID=A0AAN7GZ22_9PEZI|nr:hypothetical protein QBC38DRAFT_499386 [Podospora fimiseda]
MVAALELQWALINIFLIAGGAEPLEDTDYNPPFLDDDWRLPDSRREEEENQVKLSEAEDSEGEDTEPEEAETAREILAKRQITTESPMDQGRVTAAEAAEA